jgi:hypothetical protein
MSILRTDKEVALNDLLVASRETIDHYQDAIEYLDDGTIAAILREIIAQREPLIARIETAIRALGDLPSVPDPDKETGEMIIHHVSAALSSDTAHEVVEQRIKADYHLAELIQACRDVGLADDQGALLDALAAHLTDTLQKLNQLAQQNDSNNQ